MLKDAESENEMSMFLAENNGSQNNPANKRVVGTKQNNYPKILQAIKTVTENFLIQSF